MPKSRIWTASKFSFTFDQFLLLSLACSRSTRSDFDVRKGIGMDCCFITPSYSGDFERCKLQTETLSHFGSSTPHYIVVDPSDVAQFRSLSSHHTHVIDSRELMHKSMHPIPMSNIWVSNRGRLVRGWISQQLRKMAMAEWCTEDVLIHLDSDIAMISEFDPSEFVKGSAVGFFEIDWTSDVTRNWADLSLDLLGLPASYLRTSFVGHLVPWKRDVAAGMLEHISNTGGKHWQTQLASLRTFSEYTIYGVYVRKYLGLGRANLFPMANANVLLSYGANFEIAKDVERLIESVTLSNVAAMIHSRDDVSIERNREVINRLTARRRELGAELAL